VEAREDSATTVDIPPEYQQWKFLFTEGSYMKKLPPHRPWDHEIKLEPGTTPPFMRLRHKSEDHIKAEKAWLDDMLAKGWVRPSKSPAGAPCLAVPKKNGKIRIVTDYRRLNEMTVKDRYPLPNIGELHDRLHGARWFTKIDLRDAFYSIRMKEGEEWKTAFITSRGLHEFLVMPMGLTNAPATQQRCINDLLRDLLDITVVAYVDDILIFTKGDKKQHVRDVQEVFKRLSESDFRTAPEKCEFYKTEVEFLGNIISTEGFRPDPRKTKSITEWPTPTSVKEVQAFLGLANYNRKFIQGFSAIAAPLTALTKKDRSYEWTEACQIAFDNVKERMANIKELKMFDPELPVQIETDASDLAIGACLTQEHHGNRMPIAYYSRKMSPAEQNYDIHDKELLAVVDAL
jgi:hypothetical protein